MGLASRNPRLVILRAIIRELEEKARRIGLLSEEGWQYQLKAYQLRAYRRALTGKRRGNIPKELEETAEMLEREYKKRLAQERGW